MCVLRLESQKHNFGAAPSFRHSQYLGIFILDPVIARSEIFCAIRGPEASHSNPTSLPRIESVDIQYGLGACGASVHQLALVFMTAVQCYPGARR
jgi:hypothetical protein